MNRLRNMILCFVSFFSSFLFGLEDEGMQNVYHFKGVHFLASYCECDAEALTNLEALEQAMVDAVKECGATILGAKHHVFPPDGFTMVILLSESHATIHTYPEHGACFVDLFTCGEKCSSAKFDEVLRRYLHPKRVVEKTLVRQADDIHAI